MAAVWFGPIPFGVSATQVVSIQNTLAQLEVFYLDEQGRLFHNSQTAQNSSQWAGAVQVPGVSAKQFAVELNWDGRLEVFYIDSKDRLYHVWQLTAPEGQESAGVAWSAQTPFPLGGTPKDSAKFIAVGQNADQRLEIFYVGTDNHLFHNWQTERPNWKTGASLNSWAGEAPFPATGSHKNSAKYIAVGQNVDHRLEIFYVGTNDDIYHNWQTVAAIATAPQASPGCPDPLNCWAGETHFPAKGSPRDSAKQIAVAQDSDGRLEIFYVGTDNHLFHNYQTVLPNWKDPTTLNQWAGESRLKTAHNVTQVTAATNQNLEIEIVYIGSDRQIYHNIQSNQSNWNVPNTLNSWQGETAFASAGAKQLAMGQDANGLLECFCVSTDEALSLYREYNIVARGFGGNVNQYIYSNCDSLTGVSVTIDVTTDIVCAATNGKAVGFGFQLNTYSATGETVAWQQYTLALSGGSLAGPSNFVGGVDNWPADQSGGTHDLFDDFFEVTPTSLPGPRLPAGYKFKIILATDNQQNVSSAQYVVIDENGNTLADYQRPLLTIKPKLTSADLAPIVAVVVNLVGPINGETALLSSGAGTITYEALNALSVTNAPPPCIVSNTFVPGMGQAQTGENANSSYDAAVSVSPTIMVQAFSVIPFE